MSDPLKEEPKRRRPDAATREAQRPKQAAFDQEGVSKFVKDKLVLNWLRNKCQLYKVPYSKQAGLAAMLLDQANNHNKGKLTLPWLKNYGYEDFIPSLLAHGSEVDQNTFNQIQLQAAQNQCDRAAKDFVHYLGGLQRKAHELVLLKEQHPKINLQSIKDLRLSIKFAKHEIDKLAQWFL